jgi:hypothetical protein
MANGTLHRNKALFTSKLDLNLRKKLCEKGVQSPLQPLNKIQTTLTVVDALRGF